MEREQNSQKTVTINIQDLANRFDEDVQEILSKSTKSYDSCVIYINSPISARSRIDIKDINHIFDLLPTHLPYNLHFNFNCYRFVSYYLKDALNSVVAAHTTITSLTLQKVDITPEEAQIISEFVKTNTTLTSLNLDSNHVQDEGAASLADALMVNTTLTFLGLRYNEINDKGAIKIAQALGQNKTLTALDLTNLGRWGNKQT